MNELNYWAGVSSTQIQASNTSKHVKRFLELIAYDMGSELVEIWWGSFSLLYPNKKIYWWTNTFADDGKSSLMKNRLYY